MALGAILSGIGTLAAIKSSNDAASAANRAANRGKALDDRLVKLFDAIFAQVQNADKSGYFDPEKRIAALEKDTAAYEGRDLGNLSGALRVAGYKPGDSEIGTRLDAVKTKYRRFLDQQREDIRSSALEKKLGAYAMANPGYIQGPANNAYNQQALSLSQIQNPAGFIQSFMPFLNQPKKAGFNTAAGAKAGVL